MPALIDEVLPSNRVHLLAGVSDAGKTSWAIPTLIKWSNGEEVLGRRSHPVPWAYVAGDRIVEEAEDKVHQMGYTLNDIRIIPAFGKHNKNWINILIAASAMEPKPGLLVVEGFSDLPDGESKKEVREFLGSVSAFCQGPTVEFPKGITILGIVESPKPKPGEKYANPRHRVSGVSAWGYHSSTVIIIEGIEKDEALEQPYRQIWVCPKTGLRRKLGATFDERGRLLVDE